LLEEVCELSPPILIIPSYTGSAERSFSESKRINTYFGATQDQDRLNSLSLLSIEKDILIQLKQK